jgi:hypothetical protein
MKIYLAGSIAGGRKFEKNLEMISGTLESMGHKIISKENVVKNVDKNKSKKLLSVRKYIVKRDIGWIKKSDLFIAEVSTYSHGVGYEHKTAEVLKKPILLLRDSSLKKEGYSPFLDGHLYKKLSFSFYSTSNIKKILEKFIKKYEKR